jgi:hypothetical protein
MIKRTGAIRVCKPRTGQPRQLRAPRQEHSRLSVRGERCRMADHVDGGQGRLEVGALTPDPNRNCLTTGAHRDCVFLSTLCLASHLEAVDRKRHRTSTSLPTW